MNNTNETCTVCGGAGELAVVRLATGNLALDALCTLHWSPGALTPLEWAAQERVQCQVFPNACAMSRAELLHWLFSGSGRKHIEAWVDALRAIKEADDAGHF